MVDWGAGKGTDLGSLVQRLIGRSGEPVIRQALRQAMRILGDQFVLGETIEAALENAEEEASQAIASLSTCWARRPAPQKTPDDIWRATKER